MSSAPGRRAALFWAAGFALLAAALVARNVTALATVPPGLYTDEASIAYNAWTIAHWGVDEHGVHFPLYFEAFGEYKNPLYIYALVPLARFLPMSAAVERFPAAVFGAAAALFIALSAWRLTRSRPITAFVVVLAALTPWLVQESRVGFEVVSMVATLSVALWFLAGERRTTPARFALAGLFFVLSIFAYSTGRLEVLLFAIAFGLVYARSGMRGWWRTPVVIAAGYVVLGVWALLHPGALTAEFNLISIGADGASFPTLLGRFFSNYISYFSPDFLFIHGDTNLRHNTGYAGMLLAISAPLLLLGLWGCWRRRHESLPRFLLLCLVLGPVAAALTGNSGEPHALRSVVMLPFWFLLMIYGLDGARAVLRRYPILAAAMVAAMAVQGSLYLVDMYTAYPARAAPAFDAGVPAAITVATHAAAGHRVYISTDFEAQSVYIDAFFALQPPPPSHPVADDATAGLDALGITIADPLGAALAAQPGDVLVLAPFDSRPPGAVLIDQEVGPDRLGHPLVLVYRVAAPAA